MAEEKSVNGASWRQNDVITQLRWAQLLKTSSVLEARRRKRKSTEGRDDNPLSVGGTSRIPALSVWEKRSFRFAQTRFSKTSRAGILPTACINNGMTSGWRNFLKEKESGLQVRQGTTRPQGRNPKASRQREELLECQSPTQSTIPFCSTKEEQGTVIQGTTGVKHRRTKED